MHGFEGMGWGMGWTWIVGLLGLIAVVIFTFRASNKQGGKSALDILKERYAKGEINKTEFEEKKKDIS
jgi:putative membrane protein